jgi:hypothetical protein
MSEATPHPNFGRHLFGAAALAFGVMVLAWREYNGWQIPRYTAYAVAATLVLGGAAIQFRRAAKAGALALGAIYLAFALLCVRAIVAAPQTYNSWGNFFEQFSLLAGAAIVYARLSPAWSPAAIHRIARIFVGLCVASFALEQAFYLGATASLVPAWLPPSQRFWAIATTVFFALAALALLTNRMALLASRLLTAMLVIFGLVVWLPALIPDLHDHLNWGETVETFAIAGTAWILADLLRDNRLDSRRPH